MNIVCVGAHPDDPECYAGGTMTLWAQAGHTVHAISLTNGDIGHYAVTGPLLAARRLTEAREAARRGGYRSSIFENHDGELLPTLETRKALVCLLRECRADIVLTHRPWDYHPDHRYAAQIVQDAAFMVTVPHYCPESPRLECNPVFLYMMDLFRKPVPFNPEVGVNVDPVMDRKWALLDAMPSQFYEWLPWLDGKRETVPEDGAERLAWLREQWSGFLGAMTDRFRPALERRYGAQGASIVFAEFFEVCEYGRQPGAAELESLFPRGA